MPDSVGGRKSGPDLPFQYFKGVGPARALILQRMGIRSVPDLLQTYPRDWQDRRLRYSLHDVPIGEKTALRGIVQAIEFTTLRPPLGMATVRLKDDRGFLAAVWFKTLTPRYDVFATLREKLKPGRTLYVYGVVEWGPPGRQIRVEDYAFGDERGGLLPEDRIHFGRIVPAYTVPEGFPERIFRSILATALEKSGETLPNAVPIALQHTPPAREKTWALKRIHFPETLLEKEIARQSLAFEEFFVLETALGLLRHHVKRREKQHRYTLRRTLLTPFRVRLGFEFTEAQKRVIREIFDDLMKPYPMNRLLQGDVGSGKTVVALSAMLLAVENGGQAAFMAPTEILAEQHAATLIRLLEGLPVRVSLISGRIPPQTRKRLLGAIAQGETDIVVGTHALIQKSVRFKQLMLAVIDEQHRFGVEHRSLLREKGHTPDVLVMTATPIPRTLALTVYGDLDVSILDQMPPGRTPIDTRHVSEQEACDLVRVNVEAGRQAYVVYPLVKESDKIELKAAVEEALHLSRTVFRDLRVGVLHGQLPSKEKDIIMDRFRRKELDVLVSTTIIEVGIDVSNATVMVIQHAERFGLSTLHQLRGRVGRGAEKSFCLLVAALKSDDSRKRIAIMTETTDGFRISEEDLSMRGPGEVMGSMQHGVPVFKAGHLLHDAGLIQQARHAADRVLEADPELRHPDHRILRQIVHHQFADKWPLGTTA